MNELSIRHAEPGDLDPLMKIETDSFPPAEAASCATLAYRISDLAEWFLVGMLDGVPVGFLNGLTTRKAFIEDDIFEPGNSHPDGKTLAILSLAVSPDFRCKGLGGRPPELLSGDRPPTRIGACGAHLQGPPDPLLPALRLYGTRNFPVRTWWRRVA